MTTTPRSDDGGARRPRRLLALVLAACCLSVTVIAGIGVVTVPDHDAASVGAAATPTPTNISDIAPYYNQTTPAVDNQSWFAGRANATLDNAMTMLTRVRGFIIGTGPPGPGGPPGALLTGLLVLGVFLSAGVSRRVGPVAGATMLLIGGVALVSVSLAPLWIWLIALFILGLVVTAVFLRAVQ